MKSRDPRVAGAVIAAAVRAVVSWQAWHSNEALQVPRLDAEYYLSWARDIAGGDLLGRHGTIGGAPFLLNPLYAYVIAPFVAAFGATTAPVIVFQVLLAAATAALAASAARRWAGDAAGWVAGLAVAFSAALTHLDGYVAVSGLAAFLVAGACHACAPGDAGRGRGPLAAGVWLGLSLLARPVATFAIPLVAWMFGRRDGRPWRAAVLVLAPVVACASLSFLRNAAVSGEAIVFTAANGQNLYLGNNADARRTLSMSTDEFRFAPREMHEDAQLRVGGALGREPTRAEISSWYAARAWDEVRDHTGATLAFTAAKARWFASPAEPASSADLEFDRAQTPALRLAFVPTWLLVAAAIAGLVVCRARRDLLLGPGALVAAHFAACTLAFPLSHYRSPAIPAMAVIAGVAAAHVGGELRRGRGRALAVAAITAGVVAVAGAAGPQPSRRDDVLRVNDAVYDLQHGALDAAERGARAALAIDPESLGAFTVLMDVERNRRRFTEARVWADRRVALQPWNPLFRVEVARLEFLTGRRAEALAELDRLVAAMPWSGRLRARRGEFRAEAGDLAAAADDLRFALDRGAVPEAWALAKCGIDATASGTSPRR